MRLPLLVVFITLLFDFEQKLKQDLLCEMALKSYKIVITARHKPKIIASECIEVKRLRHANAYQNLGVRLFTVTGKNRHAFE